MFTRVIIPLAIALISSGCAYQSHVVLLKPDVNVQSGDIGSDKSIMLNVIDKRTNKTILGTKLPWKRGGGGLLTIEGDIVEIVSDALSKGLLAQGFQITRSPEEGTTKLKELRVELRSLEYRVGTALSGLDTVRTKSKMKGICIVGLSYPYEKLYRGAYGKNIYLEGYPTEASINKYVNIALSHAINNLLSDSRLLECLAN